MTFSEEAREFRFSPIATLDVTETLLYFQLLEVVSTGAFLESRGLMGGIKLLGRVHVHQLLEPRLIQHRRWRRERRRGRPSGRIHHLWEDMVPEIRSVRCGGCGVLKN